ncbi:MAG: hypothetical protein AAGD09_03375 [Cyanobacteria bacterium P01_F01_bin.56]
MKHKRTANMDSFNCEEWMNTIEKSSQRDKEIKLFLELQFPRCKWEVYSQHATGKIRMHRSVWEIEIREHMDGLWTAELNILPTGILFTGLQGKELESVVSNLKKRLRHHAQQFCMLGAEKQKGDANTVNPVGVQNEVNSLFPREVSA